MSERSVIKAGGDDIEIADSTAVGGLRRRIEPWLSALAQSDHLSLLVGNGLTTAIGYAAGAAPPSLVPRQSELPYGSQILDEATRTAELLGRSSPNIEDVIRTLSGMPSVLRLIGQEDEALAIEAHIKQVLADLQSSVLDGERGIKNAVEAGTAEGLKAKRLLLTLLLAFASRAAGRERLHVFTTNYDRLIEYACDLAGIRPIDRFVGAISPAFRASRLEIDMHYNPPGIRGEPRYLEGVIYYSKLHGSLDWRWQEATRQLVRVALPFGAPEGFPTAPDAVGDSLIIYPNPAKDVETLLFPYAELFRDFAAALCRPQAVLVTYGYGFGDAHINRIIADMLTIPSTHLLIISFDWCAGRLQRFLDETGRSAQTSLIVGPLVADLEILSDHLLPKPAVDVITARQAELLKRRAELSPDVMDGGRRTENGDLGE